MTDHGVGCDPDCGGWRCRCPCHTGNPDIRWWCGCCPAEGVGGWAGLTAHQQDAHPYRRKESGDAVVPG